MGTGEFTAGGIPAMDQHLIKGGVEILLVLVASCLGNLVKLRPDGPLGSFSDLSTSSSENKVLLLRIKI